MKGLEEIEGWALKPLSLPHLVRKSPGTGVPPILKGVTQSAAACPSDGLALASTFAV